MAVYMESSLGWRVAHPPTCGDDSSWEQASYRGCPTLTAFGRVGSRAATERFCSSALGTSLPDPAYSSLLRRTQPGLTPITTEGDEVQVAPAVVATQQVAHGGSLAGGCLI